MQATTFETLRDLVMHHAARRGWRTQRHIAVACGFDESGLSRFLNGEQDIGARRTHALFQSIGVPVEQYDLAYALLGRAQELARTSREALLVRRRDRVIGFPDAARRRPDRGTETPRTPSATAVLQAPPLVLSPAPMCVGTQPLGDILEDDVPAAVVIALFQASSFTGEQIAAFFDAAAVHP
jgi:hypothetical protein